LTETKLTLGSLEPALRAAVEAAQEKKAGDIVVLDLRGLASFTDYFLICTGTSHRQIESVADEVATSLRVLSQRPSHMEGYPRGEWVLMDYFDFVVHIFASKSREYYDLERLWGDAEKLAVAS
jgi:ribosome-associated protein